MRNRYCGIQRQCSVRAICASNALLLLCVCVCVCVTVVVAVPVAVVAVGGVTLSNGVQDEAGGKKQKLQGKTMHSLAESIRVCVSVVLSLCVCDSPQDHWLSSRIRTDRGKQANKSQALIDAEVAADCEVRVHRTQKETQNRRLHDSYENVTVEGIMLSRNIMRTFQGRCCPTTGWVLRCWSRSCFSSNANDMGLVGVVGLGKMGRAMAHNFMSAGHSLIVYDSNANAMEPLCEQGAKRARSVAHLAESSDVIVTMLPNDDILFRVTTGHTTGHTNATEQIVPKEGSLAAHMRGGALHISCSTVSPHTSRRLSAIHSANDSVFVAAPVFARPDGVARKEAYFVAGGEPEAVDRASQLLHATGSSVHVFGDGDAGGGNVVKLMGNFLIAAAIESMAEALALGEANGVDRAGAMRMLSSTIFDCLIYRGYGERVSLRDHNATTTATGGGGGGGFDLALGHKDIRLVSETAAAAQVPMPIASLLQHRFLTATAKHRQHLDWSAIALNASEDAGVDVSHAIEGNATTDTDTETVIE